MKKVRILVSCLLVSMISVFAFASCGDTEESSESSESVVATEAETTEEETTESETTTEAETETTTEEETEATTEEETSSADERELLDTVVDLRDDADATFTILDPNDNGEIELQGPTAYAETITEGTVFIINDIENNSFKAYKAKTVTLQEEQSRVSIIVEEATDEEVYVEVEEETAETTEDADSEETTDADSEETSEETTEDEADASSEETTDTEVEEETTEEVAE